MIVVDANVVVAFLLDTPFTPEARAIYARDGRWAAPPLCQLEAENALLQETRARKIALRDAVGAAETVRGLLVNRTDGCVSSAILTTAFSSGLTAYDATYVVLARSLGVLLITEDKQMLRACPDVARSMKQFLAPPEPPVSVRERPAACKTRRKRNRKG